MQEPVSDRIASCEKK